MITLNKFLGISNSLKDIDKYFEMRHDPQHNDIQHKDTQHYRLNSIVCIYAKCHYAECRISLLLF